MERVDGVDIHYIGKSDLEICSELIDDYLEHNRG